MLGAIVLHDEKAWFFKAVGSVDALEDEREAFRKLVETVQFTGDEPSWDLPDGWRQETGSGMRYATIEFGPEDAPIELSVIPLGVPDGDSDKCILDNVNRWRDQMGLSRLTADQIDEQTEAIPLEGLTAVLVDLTAERAATAMGGPKTTGPSAPGSSQSVLPATIRFDVPEGWTEGEKQVTRMGITLQHEAAFLVTDGEDQVEISVDRMPAGGSLQQNIPRWQMQIGLEPETVEIESLKIGGRDAEYVELIGQEQSVLGAVVDGDGQSWYIKLKGAKDLAEREQQRFREFLQSIRFE